MSQVKTFSLFSDFDISLFKAGKHYRLYEKLGSHLTFLDFITKTNEGNKFVNSFYNLDAPKSIEYSIFTTSSSPAQA